MRPNLNGVPNDASTPVAPAFGTPPLPLLRAAARRLEVGEEVVVRLHGDDPASARAFDLYHQRAKVKAVPKVSSKNQVTIPVEAMRAAGLQAGDEITVRPVGEGEIVIATRGSRVRRHAGIAKGIYKDGELDRLRDEWKR